MFTAYFSVANDQLRSQIFATLFFEPGVVKLKAKKAKEICKLCQFYFY